MKNLKFILAWVTMSFLHGNTQAQNNIGSVNDQQDLSSIQATSNPSSTGLTITWPVDRMVFQRDVSDNAIVSISYQFSDFSTLLSNAVSAEFSILKYPSNGNESNPVVIKNWTAISATSLNNGEYMCMTDEIVAKGWYQVHVRLKKTSNGLIIATRRVKFGVGDIYFIAGQSNAAGYEWGNGTFDDTGLIPFSESNFTQMDAVSVTKSRHIDPSGQYQFVSKGIPQTSKFQRLEKGSLTDVQSIYPNGRHSWCWSVLGSKIAQNTETPVMFFNSAVPGTSIEQWNSPTSPYYQRFRSNLQMYGGIMGSRAVLWHQGENDAIAQSRTPVTTDFSYYTAKLKSVIDKSRQEFLGSSANSNLTWFTSMVSNYSYPSDVNTQACNAYCVYNSSPPSTIGTPTLNSCLLPQSQLTYNASLVNAQFAVLNPTLNIKAGISSDGNNKRNGCRKIHFTGASSNDGLTDIANDWYNKLYPSNVAAATTPISGNTLAAISVQDLGSSYRLTLPFQSNRKYFWVSGDQGIYDIGQTSNIKDVSKLESNAVYICYYSDDNDPDGAANGWNLRLKASQPFKVPGNNKSLAWSQSTLTYSNSASSQNISVNSTNVIWDISNLPFWISTNNSTSGGDGTATLTFTIQQNFSDSREAYISLTENGGASAQSLKITQAAASPPSGCTAQDVQNLPNAGSNSTWNANVALTGGSMKINNSSFSTGLSVQVNSSGSTFRRFNVPAGSQVFTGLVGRDDGADGCNCPIQLPGQPKVMDMVFKIKNASNGATLWTSSFDHGINSPAEPFTVPLSGISQIEMVVEPGSDGQNWGDHADWVNLSLSCSTPPACSVQTPTNPTASANNVAAGTSVTLSSSCPVGTPAWSTGGTSNSIVVAPTVTTTYSILCNNGAGCASSSISITINVVAAGSCSALSNGLVMGTWNVTGNQLIARYFHGQYWLTQRASNNPEVFAVRASQLLQGDVALTNSSYYNLVGCFAYQYSNYGGLATPTSSQFPTPAGFTLGAYSDGTPIYTQTSSGGGNPPNYQGFLDNVNCTFIRGWAWDQANQSQRKNIEITVNGAVVATTTANLYSANLQAWGYNDGLYYFDIPTPASLRNGATHNISARVTGTAYVLNNTPKPISGCYSMNARIGVEETINSDEAINGLIVSPNPSDGIYNLSFSTKMGSSVALTVTSLTGNIVLQQDFKAAASNVSHIINLRNKPNGEYLVRIATEGKQIVKKIVKIE